MGTTNARATATDWTCTALTATTCRDTSAKDIPKTFAATDKTGRAALTGACAEATATQCKASGILVPQGFSYGGQKTATDYDCKAVDSTNCIKAGVTTAMTGTISFTGK